MDVKITFNRLGGIRNSLARLPKELMNSAERAVLSAGAKPILDAAKAKVPIGKGKTKGLLKKSLGLRVKKVKGKFSARVGPRTGFAVTVGMKKLKKDKYAKSRRAGKILAAKAGKMVPDIRDPNKYSHLVEFGTSRTAAKPFIRPAMDSASGEVVEFMAKGLDKHLTRVAQRLARKGGA